MFGNIPDLGPNVTPHPPIPLSTCSHSIRDPYDILHPSDLRPKDKEYTCVAEEPLKEDMNEAADWILISCKPIILLDVMVKAQSHCGAGETNRYSIGDDQDEPGKTVAPPGKY
ncbi:hypothetical protein DPMN_055352 [Dreissena polymorpha]|uniref:Uncharacterized protein n=1 Tax=Dreissena polymorpha TaxID=45954 RepID=A0A9D4HS72_DREPO|nr:hypothetical protein DPMN_055352 [Dreissena polymorpha]